MGPDCAYFMAMPITVYVGEENLVFGKAVEGLGVGGKNGILESASA
jgi:hypothetical protein